MAREVDWTFAKAVARMLGGELASVRRLTGEALDLSLEDGRRFVAKGVARQSLPTWKPGRPWAELVAIDALSAAGAPVPKLVAADLEHGWLVTEFIPGNDLNGACSELPCEGFSSLALGLVELEEVFASEWESLQAWAVTAMDTDRELAESIGGLLDDASQAAWTELTAEATAPDGFRPGPLDVRAANVIWGRTGVTFLDMASYGYDVTEKRLSAYGQRAGENPASLLDADAYTRYVAMRGEKAAVRLAFYDLLFWGIGLSRLVAALKRPDSKAARLITQTWGDASELAGRFEAMWQRKRVPDPRVEQVRRGLRPVQEGSAE